MGLFKKGEVIRSQAQQYFIQETEGRGREWLEGSRRTRHMRPSPRAVGLGLEGVARVIRKVWMSHTRAGPAAPEADSGWRWPVWLGQEGAELHQPCIPSACEHPAPATRLTRQREGPPKPRAVGWAA